MLKKKDFVEIEFTARVKDGEIFDSNIKEDLEKSNLNIEAKPFIISIGEGMFLKGVEDFLEGKDIGEYEVELTPEKAFGNRDSKLVQLMPTRIFREQNINPIPGFMFNFDGRIAKIISVSGGRIRVDFNNPIAGKTVVYKIKVLRKVDDLNEKTKTFINFLFKKDFEFEIKDSEQTQASSAENVKRDKKLIIKADKQFSKFIEIFKDKFKEVLGLELEVKEISKEASKEITQEDKKEDTNTK